MISQGKRKNSFDASLVYGTMRFNSITKRNRHVEQARRLQLRFFVSERSGLLRKDMAWKRACPVCEGHNYISLFIKDGFPHVRCVNCGLIYVNPTIKDKYRNKYFKETYHSWTKVLLTPAQKLLDTRKFRYGLKFIEGSAKKKGLLVDIGAGSGLFLRLARDSGWKVSGVEFNPGAVESIKKMGIEVFNRPLEENTYSPRSIDTVTIWEVLEHINGPDGFLKQISGILKPGGLLLICVPNINALVTRILHEKSRTFDGISHVNFFSIQTLSRLVEKIGFKVLKTDTIISELGSIKNYLSFDDPYTGNSTGGLGSITPEHIYKHNLGSRIIMLCKKQKAIKAG